MIQANVHKGLDLFEMLVKRERKKRDLVVRQKSWSCRICLCGGGVAMEDAMSDAGV